MVALQLFAAYFSPLAAVLGTYRINIEWLIIGACGLLVIAVVEIVKLLTGDPCDDLINQARWLAVLAATAIGLYLCWLMLRPFIGVLEWAIVLVIVLYPVHKRLTHRIEYAV